MNSVSESELSDGSSFSENIQFLGSNQKKIKCNIDGCRKSFKKECLLKSHIRRHNGEVLDKPFICDIEDCTKSYTNNAHLKRHKSMVHARSEELSCDFPGCGLVLSNKYSLKKHKIRIHQGEGSFSCNQCTEKFRKKNLLHQHMMTHVGSAPFRCEKCNLDFHSQIKFTKHNRNHKTFFCDCGETFTKWTLFLQHRKQTCKINIQHKCIICHKVFSTKTNLRTHSLIHVEESKRISFECSFPNCTRSYKYKKNLTMHIATFHEKKKDTGLESNGGSISKNKKNLKQYNKNVHKKANIEGKKARAPRKDTDKPKKSMAAILSGVALNAKDHKKLLMGKTVEIISHDPKHRNGKGNSETPSTEISEKNNEASQNHNADQNMMVDIVIESNEVTQENLEKGASEVNSETDILSRCDEALSRIQACLC